MRNQRVAIIEKRLNLEASGPNGKYPFEVWKGKCECCHTPMTWNINGTFAAIGTHEFDLMGRKNER